MDLGTMMQMDLPVPHEDGSFISERVSRVAELVRDYDHHLDVRWIRPNERAADEPAFAIVYRRDDASEYVVFYVQDEAHFDGSVLQRLYSMDASKSDVLCEMDQRNAQIKALAEARAQEEKDAAHDLAWHILRSKKHSYKHDGITYE